MSLRFEGKKICVTGGAGFIGSHTAKVLREEGAQVFVLDNRYTEAGGRHADCFCKEDYSDEDTLDFLQLRKVDGFVHCAGSSLVGPSIKDPGLYYDNNVGKTVKLLNHLSNWDNKPFIVFSSSAATYGIPQTVPVKENDPKKPISPYGKSKLMIERVLQDFDTAFNIKYFAYRYFNACGADANDHKLGPEPGDTHIIPKIFEAFQNNEAFQMYGTDYNTPDGTCVRDYIHVTDLAQAHALACEQLINGSASKIYNLGTNNGYSNQQLIDAFKKHVGDIQVTHAERRIGDPDELVADASKIKTDLNWEAQYSDIDTIIKDTKLFYESK